ncbi:MAG: KH domain-containing protein [Armatimonadetes bacterium]|jgi:predicted RNA-binding protein YlqC (UPF0109 family)|nr:KH domain-containing protein [Armatimonadota bacterium]
MKELIEYLVKELVSQPEAVTVTHEKSHQGDVYEIHVAPPDAGKVIGRGGKVANSLRTLVKAAVSKTHGRASVEIVTD